MRRKSSHFSFRNNLFYTVEELKRHVLILQWRGISNELKDSTLWGAILNLHWYTPVKI